MKDINSYFDLYIADILGINKDTTVLLYFLTNP